MSEDVVRAAEAFARGEVEYDETAPVELPPAPDTERTAMREVRPPLGSDQQRPGQEWA